MELVKIKKRRLNEKINLVGSVLVFGRLLVGK